MDNTTIKLECINTSNLEVITECDRLKEELEKYKEIIRKEREEIKKKDEAINHMKELTKEYMHQHEKTKIAIEKYKNDVTILKQTRANLYNRLDQCLETQNKNIIIARSSYHNINNKYWWSSIFILIFSSLITFIEATRLIIENTENQKIKALTYLISISSLFLGIIITIITGYIKFNDYQNKLEIISSRLSLLLQYQKKFEVIKFQLSTYSLPDIRNIENLETVNSSRHDIITDDIIKDFVNSLNKLEEDIQNNELLKYITDKNEVEYYSKYVDTHIKDILYNNYINTIIKFIKQDENAMDEKEFVSKEEINTIVSAIEKTMHHNSEKTNFNIIKKLFKKREIININLLKDIKTYFYNKNKNDNDDKCSEYSSDKEINNFKSTNIKMSCRTNNL